MHQTLIFELAERARLSVIHSFRVFLEAGYYRGTCQSRQSERPRLSGRDRSCVQSFWAVGSFSVAWELPALPPCRVESLSRSGDNIAPAPQCLNGPKVGNSFHSNNGRRQSRTSATASSPREPALVGERNEFLLGSKGPSSLPTRCHCCVRHVTDRGAEIPTAAFE